MPYGVCEVTQKEKSQHGYQQVVEGRGATSHYLGCPLGDTVPPVSTSPVPIWGTILPQNPARVLLPQVTAAAWSLPILLAKRPARKGVNILLG